MLVSEQIVISMIQETYLIFNQMELTTFVSIVLYRTNLASRIIQCFYVLWIFSIISNIILINLFEKLEVTC